MAPATARRMPPPSGCSARPARPPGWPAGPIMARRSWAPSGAWPSCAPPARRSGAAAGGRVVLVVSEQDCGQVSHLCVVHVELHERCEPHDLVAAMDSVGDRMAEIIAAVTETVPSFEPAQLREFPAEDVLLAPVELLAEKLAAGAQ